MRDLIPQVLFMVSSGLYFNDEEKRNRIAVFVAGLLAVIATVFTFEQIVEIVSSYISGSRSLMYEITSLFILLGGAAIAGLVGLPAGRLIRKSGVAQGIRTLSTTRQDGAAGSGPSRHGRQVTKGNAPTIEVHHHYHYDSKNSEFNTDGIHVESEVSTDLAGRLKRFVGTASFARHSGYLPSASAKRAQRKSKKTRLWFRDYYGDETPTAPSVRLLNCSFILLVATGAFWVLYYYGPVLQAGAEAPLLQMRTLLALLRLLAMFFLLCIVVSCFVGMISNLRDIMSTHD